MTKASTVEALVGREISVFFASTGSPSTRRAPWAYARAHAPAGLALPREILRKQSLDDAAAAETRTDAAEMPLDPCRIPGLGGNGDGWELSPCCRPCCGCAPSGNLKEAIPGRRSRSQNPGKRHSDFWPGALKPCRNPGLDRERRPRGEELAFASPSELLFASLAFFSDAP